MAPKITENPKNTGKKLKTVSILATLRVARCTLHVRGAPWHHFGRFGTPCRVISNGFYMILVQMFMVLGCRFADRRNCNRHIPKRHKAENRQEPTKNQAHKRSPRDINLKIVIPRTPSRANKRNPQNGTIPK